MRHKSALGVVALSLAFAMSGGSVATASPVHDDLPHFGPGSQYHPHIEPSDFSPRVDNPWFPLRPGTTWTYKGEKDGMKARNVAVATSRTKVIDGVKCRVVFDRLFLEGKLAERTFDYYTQDDDGNVWYFGEDTVASDENGNLTDTEGSFRAGVEGAQPGVFMQAHPQIGRKFRQEWLKGHAEDVFRVVSRSATVRVPYGSFSHALKTEELTALEPAVLGNKFYVRGIGQVQESAVRGENEKLVLVDIRTS